jgi:hypothetical protein
MIQDKPKAGVLHFGGLGSTTALPIAATERFSPA